MTAARFFEHEGGIETEIAFRYQSNRNWQMGPQRVLPRNVFYMAEKRDRLEIELSVQRKRLPPYLIHVRSNLKRYYDSCLVL